MQVVRGKGESKELHPELPDGTSEYAADDVVPLCGRAEE
jgi:hypothetical protein